MTDEREVCVWVEDVDGVWTTACGRVFQLNDGTPADNEMRFCYHCGRPLKEEAVSDVA